MIGNFGPEVGLLTQASAQQRAFTLAASDALPATAVLYASANDVLIGEDLYAVPAYLNAGPVYTASLRVQDILRWVIIATLIAGAILKILGVTIL